MESTGRKSIVPKRATGEIAKALRHKAADQANAEKFKKALGVLEAEELKNMILAFKVVPLTANLESKAYLDWSKDTRFFPGETGAYKDSKAIKDLPVKYEKIRNILLARKMNINVYNWDSFVIAYEEEILPYVGDTFMAVPQAPSIHYSKCFGAMINRKDMIKYFKQRITVCQTIIAMGNVTAEEWKLLKIKDLPVEGREAIESIVVRIAKAMKIKDSNELVQQAGLIGKDGLSDMQLEEVVALSELLGTALPSAAYLPDIWGKTLNKDCKAGTRDEQLDFYLMLMKYVVIPICSMVGDLDWINEDTEIVFDPKRSDKGAEDRPSWVDDHYSPAARAVKRIIVQVRQYIYSGTIGVAKKSNKIRPKEQMTVKGTTLVELKDQVEKELASDYAAAVENYKKVQESKGNKEEKEKISSEEKTLIEAPKKEVEIVIKPPTTTDSRARAIEALKKNAAKIKADSKQQ